MDLQVDLQQVDLQMRKKTIAEFSEFCIVSIPTLGLTEAQDASEHASHNSPHTPLHSFSLATHPPSKDKIPISSSEKLLLKCRLPLKAKQASLVQNYGAHFNSEVGVGITLSTRLTQI